jgi:membrane protein
VKAVIEAAPMLEALFGLGPVLLYSGLFIFLYLFIPNTSVRVPPALVGGVVAGVLYVLGQQLFTIYAARAISYSAIYGSFGAIPLTILWIYVSWTLVLLGATVCFAVQSARSYEPERKVPQREREQVAGRLVVTVAERFAAGEGPIPAQTLIDEALVPPRLGRRLLEELVEKGLLLEVVRSEEELGYAPARPLERVSLADIVDALRGKGAETPTERPAQRACVARLREADAREAAALGEISLRALLDGDASGPEALARNGDDAARPKAAPPALARRSDDGGST